MTPTDVISLEGPLPGAFSVSLSVTGTCDGGRVRVEATTGGGCVESGAWQAVIDALAPLRAMKDDVIAKYPLPIEPSQITFGDGTVLSLASPPRIGDSDADRMRVEKLVFALMTDGKRTARPAGTPRSTLTVRDAAGTEVVLELFDHAIARRGEPGAIALDAELLAVIAQPPSAYLNPLRWREDVTTLSSLTINGTTYTRGAVLGEWTRTPAGAVDGALVDALAQALAIVRAPNVGSEPPLPLSIHVTFTPPAGKPTTHELALGAPNADGCPARIDGALVRADLELCTAAHALAGH
jgi:hypothetical protein